MHKKLSSELSSLAHKILQMNNKDNVFLLKEKAHELYEKLSVLAYIEHYINTTPQATETKEELIQQFEESLKLKENKQEEVKFITEPIKVEESIDIEEGIENTEIEEPQLIIRETESLLFPEEEIEQIQIKPSSKETTKPTLEDELNETTPINLLEKVIKFELNDRIDFVNNLFEGSHGDFNRVVSQLNTFYTEKEAKDFIKKTVKPDYDWSDKQKYEEKFLEIITQRFR